MAGPSSQALAADGPSKSDGRATRQLPTYTREDVKAMIASGDVLVLHRAVIYRLNSWLKRHPGGELALLHFVGRDATDEIEAYHPSSVLAKMPRFAIGRVAADDWEGGVEGNGWRPLMPPVEVGMWPLIALRRDADDSGYSSGDSGAGDRDAPPKRLRPSRSRLALLEPPPLTQEALSSGFDVSPARQHRLALSFRRLHERVRAKGFYEAPSFAYGYGPDLARFSLLFLAFFICSPFAYYAAPLIWQSSEPVSAPGWTKSLASAIFLGLWWHQITFVAHDAGHSGITGRWWVDRCIGVTIANFFGGLSIGWWCDNHDVHHLVTNHPEHDPDIQHMPFFAISSRFFDSLRSTYYKRIMTFDGAARFFVAAQHRIYYFVMMFGRFNLFVNSYAYLWYKAPRSRLRTLEVVGVVCYWAWFGTLLYLLPSLAMRIVYVLVSFAVTSPLHVQIVLSHFAQSTVDLGPQECFAHRQIRTTMDVTCPPYLDFLHGGLHMQVTHHLFPRIPRHRLREACAEVVRWCADEGLEYRTFTFAEGNRKVLGVLSEVAKQVKVLGVVAQSQVHGHIHH